MRRRIRSFTCCFYINGNETVKEMKTGAVKGKGKANFSQVNMGVNERKIGQTSDVFESASKRFKALKCQGERLVYQ